MCVVYGFVTLMYSQNESSMHLNDILRRHGIMSVCGFKIMCQHSLCIFMHYIQPASAWCNDCFGAFICVLC